MAKTILIVDDEVRITMILSEFLSREGFDVMTAIDGRTALKMAKESLPDLIVLDVTMPDMDGGDVMASIMKDNDIKNIPIVLLTGLIAEHETSDFSKSFSGRVVLSKALDINEQVKKIKRVLEEESCI